MKIGIRKPSIKKSLAARTSPKRYVANKFRLKMPRGYGWITNPQKNIYNKIYNKSTISVSKILKRIFQ